MNAILTNIYREKLADAAAGLSTLPAITHIAFGDGGHDGNNDPLAEDPEQTVLNNELLRKPLDSISKDGRFTFVGLGVLLDAELVGDVISESGLIDADGDLVGFKNGSPKIKDADDIFERTIRVKF